MPTYPHYTGSLKGMNVRKRAETSVPHLSAFTAQSAGVKHMGTTHIYLSLPFGWANKADHAVPTSCGKPTVPGPAVWLRKRVPGSGESLLRAGASDPGTETICKHLGTYTRLLNEEGGGEK